MTFPQILFAFSALYALWILLFTAAAALPRPPRRHGYKPRVSVIVAARDEEERIPRCLESLGNLSYPQELLEVIIVDDGSTDATAAIIDRSAALHSSMRRVAAIAGIGNFRGKTNAVAQGIEASSGEILLFTDADCVVPRDWIERTVEYYADDTTGVVAGFTMLDSPTFFAKMQAIDWFFLFSVAAASLRIGFPTTAVGNNLSVRRTAYDATGGYRKIPFSVTEDYALYHAIVQKTRFKARFPLDRSTLVVSAPCDTAGQLFRQKLRWFTGGKDMDLKNLFVFGIAFLLNLLLPVGLFCFGPVAAIGLAFALKFGADFILTFPAILRFRAFSLIPAYPLFALYYYIYVLLYPPLILLGLKVTWKNRLFENRQ